ncbi:unnamed protein product [Closterium sp. NIES-53]
MKEVEEVAVVEAVLGAAVVEVAVVHQAEGALEEVLTHLLEEVRPAVVRCPSSSSSHSRDSSSSRDSSRDSSNGQHHSGFSHGDPHCSGVRSSTGALRHSGDLEDPGALDAAAALPARPRAPHGATPALATTSASPDWAVPLSVASTTTMRRDASAVSTTTIVVDLCLSSLGACVSALGACLASGPGTPQAEVSLPFTLDSGVSQCFFCDHTTLTPLLAPILVALADPSSGPAVARSSTTLPCHVVPSGVLRGFHIPSFTRNLVGVGYLHDRGITVTFVGGGRTAVCTDAATGAILATFTREPHSGLYVLHTEHSPAASSAQVAASPPVPVSSPVAVSGQVVVSGQVAASCSCRSLAHPTILWHYCLGHLSLPCLRSKASHSLVSGLPCVFQSLPPSLLHLALLASPAACAPLRTPPFVWPLLPSNTPLCFWSVIAFVAVYVALSSQQHAVLELLLSKFLGQIICCHLGRGAVG